MNQHALYALEHPLNDPDKDVRMGHYWRCGPRMTACLTVTLAGAPWWQLSVACSDKAGVLPLAVWSAKLWDKAAAVAAHVFNELGEGEVTATYGMTSTRQWLKPLSLAEISRLRGNSGASQ
jgi:hypothetical protein